MFYDLLPAVADTLTTVHNKLVVHPIILTDV